MKSLYKITAVIVLLNTQLLFSGAGRDNNILAPVQACGDGVLSGVNTVSCIQAVSASSSGSMSGSGSPAFPAPSPAAAA